MICSVINEPTVCVCVGHTAIKKIYCVCVCVCMQVPILLSAANSPASSFAFRGREPLQKEP